VVDEERFRMFVENANDILFTLTSEGVITYASPNWKEWLGHDDGEVLGTPYIDFVHPEDAALFETLLERVIGAGVKQAGVDYRLRRKDGGYRWFEANASPLCDVRDEQTVFLGVARDVTEKKRLEENLYESNERLENLLLELPVAIMIVEHSSRRILEINPQAMLLLGCTSEQLIGQRCMDSVCPMTAGECPIVDHKMEGDHCEREVINASGERIAVHKSAITMQLDARKVILECFTDISRMKEMERRLHEMARTDDLTGLHNRRHFMESSRKELSNASRHGYPVSMIGFDIDHFKHINDTFGHPAGDEVLRMISRICREALRSGDVAARIGGEEFGILLPHTDAAAAASTAERLRASVEKKRCLFEGQQISCTISLGVAEANLPDEDLEGLIKRADKALYQAKRSGRNRVCSGSTGP
jgi:diguanylate cyclase (GGDEF)-like protein/PAS domain S-box-containing protein